MAKVSGKSDRLQHADSTFVARSIYYTINEPSYDKRLLAIRSIADQELTQLSQAEQDEIKASFNTRVKILSSEQFYTAAQQKPEDPLLRVNCPVLIILGGNDLNVDANYYGPKMKVSMQKNYNPKSKLYVLPGINHMMQFSKTGLSEESKQITETINTQVLDIIGSWTANLER